MNFGQGNVGIKRQGADFADKFAQGTMYGAMGVDMVVI
jgi:hypothetical protein